MGVRKEAEKLAAVYIDLSSVCGKCKQVPPLFDGELGGGSSLYPFSVPFGSLSSGLGLFRIWRGGSDDIRRKERVTQEPCGEAVRRAAREARGENGATQERVPLKPQLRHETRLRCAETSQWQLG